MVFKFRSLNSLYQPLQKGSDNDEGDIQDK